MRRARLAAEPFGRPRCPEPSRARAAGAHRSAPDSPLLGCGDSVETRSGSMSRVAGPAPAITRLFSVLDHGSARRQSSCRSFPSRCGAALASPHLSPAGLPQSGRPQPAARVIPPSGCPSFLYADWGWGQGSRGGERGMATGRWNEGARKWAGRGSAGPAAPAGP